MKVIKYYSIVLLLIVSACEDKFLENSPQGRYLQSNYYETEDQFFKGLIAAYDPLQWTFPEGAWTSNVMLGEIRSDNANAGGDPSNGDQPGWQAIDDFLNTSQTLESQSFWKRGYWGIYRSNIIINNENLSSETIDLYKAEARFLRAWYHFDLLRIFGPIPIIDRELLKTEYANVERANISDLFSFIVDDLEVAIATLPETKYTGEFAGRASKTTAQAVLGKVYLYWADMSNDDPALFDLAADNLEAVISSGQYNLLDNFNDLFAFGAKNTEESVFEIQYTNAVPADWAGEQFIDGNMITQLCGIRGLCSDHPEYDLGWGFLLPTENLYNHFLADDTLRQNAAFVTQGELSAIGCSVDLTDQNQNDFEGYWQQKYANYSAYTAPNGGDINLQKDPNEPVIRFADVLLMAAEALHRGTGSDAQAMDYIDRVRERAAGPGDNSGNFRTTAQLMSDEGFSLLDAIWYERRAELAGEGDRWFDLVRSDRVMGATFGSKGANISLDELYLPIPQRDIDNTGGNLTAYPSSDLFN